MSRHQQDCPHNYGKVLAAVFLLFVSSFIIPDAFPQTTSVWRVIDGQHMIYLGGVVHRLRRSDYPLPEAFYLAYKNADEVYIEVDGLHVDSLLGVQAVKWVKDAENKAMIETSIHLVMRENGEIDCIISGDFISSRSIRVDGDQLIDGCIVSAIDIVENHKYDNKQARSFLQDLGYGDGTNEQSSTDAKGVDEYFVTRAVYDGKPVGGLEMREEAISDLADAALLHEIDADDGISGALSESQSVELADESDGHKKAHFDEIVGLWRSGSVITSGITEVRDITVRRRNLRWLPRIEAMFEDADTEYVLVGVGHMYYDGYGLLELLQERGYTIEQL